MDRTRWSEHLAAVAGSALRGTPLAPDGEPNESSDADARTFLDEFADELGHRRAVDRPLIARLLGVDPGEPPAGIADATPDVALWWSLHTDLRIPAFPEPDLGETARAPAPIIGEAEFARGAIEATTETELGALHALAHHARAHERGGEGNPDLWHRCLDAARWHVDTLQPDNGTNHPWAIHVFVELAEADPAYAPGATIHAEGLLHNAIVRSGKPDRFSACVLLDSARTLAGPPA